ncbi:exocyst complex component 5-like isoform X2 [Asterias rubens]|uniref:exocyst complex component 5-like isoform X2 n=1 Tax=Asterias rubens TaxID=7604 RepID=UPI0014555D30|nr:exocyst complex component 5-like isoform X2 [Asterias rubens]
MSSREFESATFDPEQYIEQLAWRTQGGDSKEGPQDFDAKKMLRAFENTIEELKLLSMRMEERTGKLDANIRAETKSHAKRVAQLQENNKMAFLHFQELDDHINNVATKVVHLGDQLEGVNTPRARAEEAKKLIEYFSEFLDDYGPKAEVFNDPFQLQDAADIIQKLQLISQELPQEQFEKPKMRIQEKYNQIEDELITEFRSAFHEVATERMRELAGILAHFKGYHRCVDAFIEESQANTYIFHDVYEDLIPLCKKVNSLVHQVFSSPESVMGKFVLNLYEVKLQEHVKEKLSNKDEDREHYLKHLHELYARTGRLTAALSDYRLGSDAHLLTRLTKHIFEKYLQGYIQCEELHLREKMSENLKSYYSVLGHQKKLIQQTGGLQDLQNKLRTKAPLHIGSSGPQVDFKGQTFLSQEIALNLLNESKQAFNRCQLLSTQSTLSTHAIKIFDILTEYLCQEHIEYALEIGLQGIPSSEPKSFPQIYFFNVAGEANAIFHLLEKQFSDVLVPLISSSPAHSECVQKKKQIMEQMESKTEIGLERTLSTICGWIKYLLDKEQKKSDFRPESEEGPMELYSTACAKVIPFIEKQVENIKRCLDGKNVTAVLMEFGIRFHRVIFDHLQQYTYNSLGAMLVICDVNEYRRLVKSFKVPMVNSLFEKLHALCNLLVVVPENIKSVITGEQLGGLDKNTPMSFVQLRADFKAAKIAQQLR